MLNAVAAVLADQSVDPTERVVPVSARSDALPVRRAARRDPLGRELSAGAGLGRVGRRGSGAAGRRRLRRQHARRDRRLARREPAADRLARQPALAAGADRRRRAVGAHPPAGRRSRRTTVVLDRGRWRAALLAFTVPPLPGMLVAFGRYTATQLGQADIIYVGEGWNASVAVSERSERRAQLPQRRQGAGVERAAGHAAAAHARPSDDARADEREDGARHRLRRRRHGRRRVDRSGRRARDDRRDRAARAARRLDLLRRAQLRRRPQSEGAASTSTMRGIFCSRRTRSSTRSRRIRSIRG